MPQEEVAINSELTSTRVNSPGRPLCGLVFLPGPPGTKECRRPRCDMNADPLARFTCLRPIVASCDTGQPFVDCSKLRLCRFKPTVSRHRVQLGGVLSPADFKLKTIFLDITFNHQCGQVLSHETGSIVFAWNLN